MIEMGPQCVPGKHYFAVARGQAETLRMGPKIVSTLNPQPSTSLQRPPRNARFVPWKLSCSVLDVGCSISASAFSVSAQITHAQPKSPVRVNFRMFEREFPLRQQLFRDHGRTVSLELATSFLGEFRLKISGENRYSQFCFSTSGARLVWGFIQIGRA